MIRCICRIQGIEILNDTVYRYMMIYNQMPQFFQFFMIQRRQVPRPKLAPRPRPRPKVKPRQIAEERPVAFWHQRLGPRRSEDFSDQTYRVLFFDWRKKEGASFFFLGRDFRGFVFFLIRMSFDCLGWFWYVRLCFAQPLIQEWRALRTPLAFLIRLKQPDYLTGVQGRGYPR